MRILVIYLAIINSAAFGIMGADKSKARRHANRISEKSIFISGILGGGLGLLLGMGFFHHKTRHLRFKLGVPAIVILNIIMFGYVIQKLM